MRSSPLGSRTEPDIVPSCYLMISPTAIPLQTKHCSPPQIQNLSCLQDYKCAPTALGLKSSLPEGRPYPSLLAPPNPRSETLRLPGRPAPGSSAGSARTSERIDRPQSSGQGSAQLRSPAQHGPHAPGERPRVAAPRAGSPDSAPRRPEVAGATGSAFPLCRATTHAEAPRRSSRPGRPRPGPSLTQSSVPQLMVQGPGRGPRPPSPAIAAALRTLRMRKARRFLRPAPPLAPARHLSSLRAEQNGPRKQQQRPPQRARPAPEPRGGVGRDERRDGAGPD